MTGQETAHQYSEEENDKQLKLMITHAKHLKTKSLTFFLSLMNLRKNEHQERLAKTFITIANANYKRLRLYNP